MANVNSQTVIEKLNAEIQRIRDEKADPNRASPLAPVRDQILEMKNKLGLPYRVIAELITKSGIETNAAAVSKFYANLRTKKAKAPKSDTPTSK